MVTLNKGNNTLVIIGNGFDLKHGLKTSFYDFINYCAFEYLKMIFYPNFSPEVIEEELIIKTHELFKRGYPVFDKNNSRNIKVFSIKDYFSITKPYFIDDIEHNLIEFDSSINYIIHYKNIKQVNNLIYNKNRTDKYFFTENIFVSFVIANLDNKSWAGIENDYYTALLHVAQIKIDNFLNDLSNGHYFVTRLNEEFDVIVESLQKYLSKIEKDRSSIDIDNKLSTHLVKLKNDLMVLNFNYTNTLAKYKVYDVKLKDHIDSRVIHIHGKLNSKNNPIIFGYGDHLDQFYKKLEDLNDNQYLKNVKFLRYMSKDYHLKIHKFLNNEKYDVIILGHSCSTSDRILLKEIFNHSNCKSIEPFYHINGSNDDYHDRIINISRSFDNKNKMQTLVKRKDNCRKL